MEDKIVSNENKTRSGDITLRTAAITAGAGLLIMTIAAMFAEFFVRSKLVVAGDAAATVNNISANGALFRSGIAGYIIVIVMDVVTAWALYVLLKPINKSLSLLTGWFRLVYATIFAVSLFNLVTVSGLVNGLERLKVFGQ